jgi:hypothetical protein
MIRLLTRDCSRTRAKQNGGWGVRLTDVWHRFPASPSVLRIPLPMGLSFHMCLAMSPDVPHNPELERG